MIYGVVQRNIPANHHQALNQPPAHSLILKDQLVPGVVFIIQEVNHPPHQSQSGNPLQYADHHHCHHAFILSVVHQVGTVNVVVDVKPCEPGVQGVTHAPILTLPTGLVAPPVQAVGLPLPTGQ